MGELRKFKKGKNKIKIYKDDFLTIKIRQKIKLFLKFQKKNVTSALPGFMNVQSRALGTGSKRFIVGS